MKKSRKVYIGIDVGGTKILGGLVEETGKVLSRRKVSTPRNASASKIYQLIVNIILHLQSEYEHTIRGIGLGIPGIVSPDFKRILITPNINLTQYPLQRNLRRRFRKPVLLANDVNCGLLGEQWKGAARKMRNVVGIFPGTGIGGALILNGEIFTGAQGAAAEIGHMVLDYNSCVTHAGVTGSLEALASRRAIERQIRAAVKKGHTTRVTKWLDGNLKAVKSKVLARALKQHDRVVMGIINQVCLLLGQTCISLRHVLNPDLIILGGGLIEACGFYMLPRVRRISRQDPFFKGIDRCEILPSCLGDDAVMLGAVRLIAAKDKR